MLRTFSAAWATGEPFFTGGGGAEGRRNGGRSTYAGFSYTGFAGGGVGETGGGGADCVSVICPSGAATGDAAGESSAAAGAGEADEVDGRGPRRWPRPPRRPRRLFPKLFFGPGGLVSG